MAQARTSAAPEPGQTVLLRHKIWEVTAVSRSKANGATLHCVDLEGINDDTLDRQINVAVPPKAFDDMPANLMFAAITWVAGRSRRIKVTEPNLAP